MKIAEECGIKKYSACQGLSVDIVLYNLAKHNNGADQMADLCLHQKQIFKGHGINMLRMLYKYLGLHNSSG